MTIITYMLIFVIGITLGATLLQTIYESTVQYKDTGEDDYLD